MTVDPRESELPVPLGSIIAGKYRVDKVLGIGGMGVVAVGRHLKLDQKVAIKILRPAARADRELVARFEREARAASRISSDHVARVIDVGETTEGVPFMVMEYLDGSDLGQVVKARGQLPITEAVDYVLQACEALAEAHRAGIVHRDLKPANLFLSRRADGSPLVKVLDFGISKLKKQTLDSEELTRSEVIMGSPHYMSPEQLRSPKDVDARADIWALGAIVHKLVTGDPPFMGCTTAELCAQVLTQVAPCVSAKRPDAPRALDETVARCLTADPAARFQTVAELADALAALASDEGHSSVRAIARFMALPDRAHRSSAPPPPPALGASSGMSVPATEIVSIALSPVSTSSPTKAARSSTVIAAIAAAVVVVGALGGVAVWRTQANADGAKATGAGLVGAASEPAPLVAPAKSPADVSPAATTAEPTTQPQPSTAVSASKTPALPVAHRPPAVPTAKPVTPAARPTATATATATVAPAAPPPGDLGFGNRK